MYTLTWRPSKAGLGISELEKAVMEESVRFGCTLTKRQLPQAVAHHEPSAGDDTESCGRGRVHEAPEPEDGTTHAEVDGNRGADVEGDAHGGGDGHEPLEPLG